MVTLVDLVSLMLAFFVLRFAMTNIDTPSFEKAAGDLDPYFSAGQGTGKEGGRLNLKNGTEQHLLDTVVRPMWSVAEQLVGAVRSDT